MSVIIGLDFGNTRSFTSFVQGNDPVTRLGGVCRDLLPEQQASGGGIPSVFFYSQKRGELVGPDALSRNSRPAANRRRLLKRHLGESFVIDGVTFQYDNAIKKVAEYCIRMAMKELWDQYHLTTHKVSLAYPVSYNSVQRKHLIDLVNSITIDGKPVQVTGTIAEPAAAALDYLAEHGGTSRETTVLAFDLGGGTFDLSVVTVYPDGKKRSSGQTYYYDIVSQNGVEIGGEEFDQKLREIIIRKMGEQPTGATADMLPNAVETTKIYLSDHESAEPDLTDRNGDYYDFTVTRAEFEQATKHLVDEMVGMTSQMLKEHPEVSLILLTGGASQMPMIRNALARAVPNYKDRIIFHRPSRAISYGAARYGTNEESVQQRTIWDLGIGYYDGDDRFYVDILIPAGTAIPCTYYSRGYLRNDTQFARATVYEACVSNPDAYRVEQDFREILVTRLEFQEKAPKGTLVDDTLAIDEHNVLTVMSSATDNPNIHSTNHIDYKNLQ